LPTAGGSPEVNPTPAWLAMLVPTMIGLCTSTILLVDYIKPAPVFCGASGGCEALRRTMFAYPMGIPMPAFGVLGFAIVAVLFFLRGARVRALHLGFAAASGLVGGFLLGLQLMLGKMCIYCAITDVCALLGLAAAIFRVRRAIDPPKVVPPVALALGLLLSSVGAPAALGATLTPAAPGPILAEIKDTPHGQVTIVDFVDFQCPFCRQTHMDLAPLLKAHPGKIRVVRKQVPLSFHRHALDAARAACCGEDQGKGDEMADRLFATPPDDLTPDGCRKIAAELGLDVARYDECVADPETDKRIQRDKDLFHAIGGEGLPTLFIGAEKIEGAQGPDVLRKAIDRALAGS
jgi:protein-disulfide isomerase